MWNDLRGELKQIKQYSTPVGNVWFVVQFIFRLMIVTMVGSQVYGDEQGQFKCDTGQPGCQNVCYNRFSPISHLRFWSFQLLFLSMPKFFLYAYISLVNAQRKIIEKEKEKLNNEEATAEDDESQITGSQLSTNQKSDKQYRKLERREKKYKIQASQIKMKNKVDDRGNVEEVMWTPGIRACYVTHLIVQLAVELVMIYGNYLLQQNQTRKSGWEAFFVPERYDCMSTEHTKPPWGNSRITACSQNEVIACWVSRPWEKGIFVIYMAVMAGISIFITIVELIWMVTHMSYKGMKRRREQRWQKFNLIKTTRARSGSNYNPYLEDERYRIPPQGNTRLGDTIRERNSRPDSALSNSLRHNNKTRYPSNMVIDKRMSIAPVMDAGIIDNDFNGMPDGMEPMVKMN